MTAWRLQKGKSFCNRVFLLLLGLWFFTSCSDPGSFPVVKNSRPDRLADADIVIRSFTVNAFDNTRTLWQLKSEEAYIYQNKKLTYVYPVSLEYFEKPNEKTSIVAQRGILDEKSNTLELKGGVIVSSAGRSVYSEYLMWNEKLQKLYTDQPVRIVFSNGDEITGENGLEANQDLSKIVILQGSGIHRPGRNK